MERLVVRNGEVVTPFARSRADVLIEDGTIKAIGRNLEAEGCTELDASGKLVLPGLLDVHTHMALPMKGTTSSDDFRSGTRAAAFGGVTTIVDFTEMAEGEAILKAVDDRKRRAQGECYVDWSLHVCVRGWSADTAEAVSKLIDEGLTSFKMFTVYGERGLMSDDRAIYKALDFVSRNGGTVSVHCENEGVVQAHTESAVDDGRLDAAGLAESRPNLAEGEAVQRMVTLAEATGGRLYVVHVSTREGLAAIEAGQSRGVDVIGETCPQYLVLDRDRLAGDDGYLYTCVPPLRSALDRLSLWKGLEEGILGVVATDHCPFFKSQKEAGRDDFTKIPLGLPGTETLLPLLYTYGVAGGHMTINQLVQVLGSNPAMVFGLYPRKGIINVGSDGDLVIFDPSAEAPLMASRLHMNTDYSPYEGLPLRGRVETTIARGRVLVKGGEFTPDEPAGEFIARDRAER